MSADDDNDRELPTDEQHARVAAFLVFNGEKGHPITRWNNAIDAYNRELAAYRARPESGHIE